jgi:hypothetical protein
MTCLFSVCLSVCPCYLKKLTIVSRKKINSLGEPCTPVGHQFFFGSILKGLWCKMRFLHNIKTFSIFAKLLRYCVDDMLHAERLLLTEPRVSHIRAALLPAESRDQVTIAWIAYSRSTASNWIKGSGRYSIARQGSLTVMSKAGRRRIPVQPYQPIKRSGRWDRKKESTCVREIERQREREIK